ncbi:alpha/beta hydrolase [Sphingobacterium sp. CZ-2]|uniref:alpha/beta hydrolase n=1 Tax=Sphingobacterium sp. CZ-2 TaxID=2557994 RepID=UPI001AD9BA86|nr:alpha/beta fold hydrolase [Sphingobacterium sp. CZ-2]
MKVKIKLKLAIAMSFIMATGYVSAQNKEKTPITIQAQGSFMAGGTTLETAGTFKFSDFLNPSGQMAYVDHAYAFYQIPANGKKLPLVFLHGGGQTGKTWETTPDGREGFQNIFLRKGYSVYIVDQPRRGRAGSAGGTVALKPHYLDKALFSLFRIGNYPNLFPGSQFPKDAESLNQIMRWATPDTGPYDDKVTSDAMAAVLDKSGAAILVTHSRGGYPGWLTALKTENVKAIVSFEPGGSAFVFPEGEVPEPVPTAYGFLKGDTVPLS